MSKTNKRKSNESKNNKEQKRQSVFERLGTKERVTSNHLSLTVNTSTGGQEFCRNWAQNGACPFGKNCKLSNTHILISPSKRNNKKDDLSGNLKILTERAKGEEGKRVVSTLSRRVGSPELNSWETWDQTELEYEDEKVLEKRRQLLQRELDLHMKKDSRKDTSAKVQRRSSSTSSCSSSSSGSSSSSVSSSESSANRRTDVKKKKRSTSSPSGSERNLKKTRGKLSVKESTPRKSSSSGGSKKLPSPSRKRKKSTSSTPPRKLAPPPTSPSKNRSSMTNSRRKESPERRGRTGSSERKKHRSTSRNRRRGSSPRPVSRRPRTPDSKISSSSSSSRQPRNRSSDRKKEDDRKSKEDFKRRKSDYRDKRDVHDDRSREKARELREAAREKERSEALERCRERQREREAAAKEKDRLREERERERKEAAAKRDRDRKERRNSRERRRPDDKRHDRMYDRKISDERERRDRALERVMERKSVERSRERDRGRDSYERSRKIIDEKPYASPYRCDKRRYDMREGLSPHDERLTSPYRSGEKRRYDALREGLSPREERICSPGYRSEKRGRYDMSPREDRMRNYSDERRRERNRPSGGWNGEGSSNRFEERDKSTSRGDWERDFQETPRRDWESRRNHLENEKDRASVDEKEKDSEGLQSKRISRGSGDEIEETAKKPRIEDTSSLQEELSDISDDADDILNREDVEFMEGDESRLEGENEQVDQDESSQSHQQPVSPEHRGIESRLGEDEGMVGLDFEEISDEELEEESKMNKGGSVGDALGVDWASLMATCKQQRKPANESSARSYWETGNMLARIGVSKTMASPTMYSTLKEKYPQAFPNEKHGDVAALCRPLRESKSMKEKLISSNMLHKQALSARADLSIRRQLCGLPVVTLETHQNIGFCQWTV